jgi:hypothetical protein
MVKGDSAWSKVKVILGWVIGTIANTISLLVHRLTRIREILASIGTTQHRVSLKKWQQILGEIRSMALTIPAAIGLFLVLQEALKASDGHRARLTRHTHDFLHNFCWLVDDVGTRPTAIDELVPDQLPSTHDTCDASKKGLGGVYFVPLPGGQLLPLLWREALPTSIATKLVSTNNPTGTITNSDLELAATIAQFDVLAQSFDVRSHTVHNLSDNAVTVAWKKKGAASSSGPVAYLLRLHALHQRHHRYLPLHDFITGVTNVLADQCSRHFHLTDAQLLSHFNASFPQTMPWRMCHLLKETLSAMISALSKRRPALASLLNAPERRMRIGTVGKSFASRTTLPHSSKTVRTQSPPSKSSLNDTEMDARLPCIKPSDLVQWKTPSARWARRSPNWGGADIRKDAFGAIDSRISRQFRCYRKEEAPPSRVKPVPIVIIIFILHQAFIPSSTPDRHTIANLVTITFYFLLHPGEYTGTTSDDAAFRLTNIELHVDDRAIDPITCSDSDLYATTFMSLTFTTQKNGTKGEVITHGIIHDALACPVKATVRRILHLRDHKSSKTTPLASYFHKGKRVPIKAADVTTALRLATIAASHQTGLHHRDISARSLRAGGAMALMCEKSTTTLFECWVDGIATPCCGICISKQNRSCANSL